MHSYIQSLLGDDQNINQSGWNSRYNRFGGVGRSAAYCDDISTPWGGRSNRLGRFNRNLGGVGGFGGSGLYDDGFVGGYGSAGRIGRSNLGGNAWADELAYQQQGYGQQAFGNYGRGGYNRQQQQFGLGGGAYDDFGNVGGWSSRFNRFGGGNVLGGNVLGGNIGGPYDQFGNYNQYNQQPWGQSSRFGRFGRGQVGVGAFGAGLCGDDFEDLEYDDELNIGGGLGGSGFANRIGVKHLPIQTGGIGGGNVHAGIIAKVKQNIVEELAVDRERDEFQVNLVQQFIKNRRHQSNTPQIVKALVSGERVPKKAIVQGLLEDVAVNRVADAVALQALADNQINRNADHIVQDLIVGEIHLPHSNQYEYQHQDAKFDNTLEILARKLSSPNAGRKLVRKGIVDDVIELAGARQGLQNQLF